LKLRTRRILWHRARLRCSLTNRKDWREKHLRRAHAGGETPFVVTGQGEVIRKNAMGVGRPVFGSRNQHRGADEGETMTTEFLVQGPDGNERILDPKKQKPKPTKTMDAKDVGAEGVMQRLDRASRY
jgi:hypothetical protein